MAYRDKEMLPQEFLRQVLGIKRRHLRGIRSGPAITVVAGCTGYVLTQAEYRPGRKPDLTTMLVGWGGHSDSPAQ